MQPSEVRRRILDDHAGLRQRLQRLEALAAEPLSDRRAATLRAEGLSLLEVLQEHMRWEDLYLAPALRDADAWGEERAAKLAADHLEQREVLAEVVARLEDANRPDEVIRRTVADFVEMLREDMVDEEDCLVRDDVLRDDPVGVDVEAG
jgi:hypothetical protein